MTKNPAAVALGKKRWAKTSDKDISEHMDKLRALAIAKMTPAQKLARAKKASAAAAKARKLGKGRKKTKISTP